MDIVWYVRWFDVREEHPNPFILEVETLNRFLLASLATDPMTNLAPLATPRHAAQVGVRGGE